jgi:hypothetical protein
MVELAARLHPEVTFKVGNAENLPFADGSFDAVGSNFGMHDFPHPETALAEAFRVLRPGGRIAFTVWARRDKAVALDMVLKAIEAHGETDVALPEGPPLFRFSDWGECTRALLEAGFAEPKVQEVPQTWSIRAPETPFHALMRGGVRVAAILKAQTPEALALIEKAVSVSAAAYRVGDEVRMPMSAVLASARKRYGLSARMTAAAATRFRTVARGAASAAGRPGRTCRNRFGLASLASQPPLKALWHQVSDARPRFPAPSAHCGRRRRRRGRTSIDGDMGNAGKCEDVGRPATGSTGPNKGTAPLVYSSTSFCSATACRPELYVPAATGSHPQDIAGIGNR